MTRQRHIDQIARKTAARLTSVDKNYIINLSRELGVEFKPRPHCPDCYADQAILLRKRLMDADAIHNEAPAYILRAGCDVIYKGIRVCEDTITDELAEQLIKMGFNRKFFAKCK